MCGEKESKGSMKKVTLVMHDGAEIGPVKISGKLAETNFGLEGLVYANAALLPDNPSVMRFAAVYTNFKDRQPKLKK